MSKRYNVNGGANQKEQTITNQMNDLRLFRGWRKAHPDPYTQCPEMKNLQTAGDVRGELVPGGIAPGAL